MLEQTTAARSEYLPRGTEIEFTLKVKAGSPVLDILPELLAMGKNKGLGQWSGSGGRGAFMYQIEDCEEPKA